MIQSDVERRVIGNHGGLHTDARSRDDRDEGLVAALRCGDESAFAEVVDRFTPTMLRIARGYVASHEAAEDVVQETWIALLKGIDKFERCCR